MSHRFNSLCSGKSDISYSIYEEKKDWKHMHWNATLMLTCEARGDLVSGAFLFALKFPLRMLRISVIVKEKQFYYNKVKF